MSAIEICFCILILSSAFTLVTLGILFLKTATSVKQIGETAQMMQTTVTKVDKIADDITYKLDLINAPFETISGLFNPNRPKFNVFSIIKSFIKK